MSWFVVTVLMQYLMHDFSMLLRTKKTRTRTRGGARLPAEGGGLAVLQLADVLLADAQALLGQVHDEERAAAAPVVGVQPQLLQPDVVHDAHLRTRQAGTKSGQSRAAAAPVVGVQPKLLQPGVVHDAHLRTRRRAPLSRALAAHNERT